MAFLTGGSGGADCGPVNPMAGLMKQFQQDRSLQQDRFNGEQTGESSKASFRTRPIVNGRDRQLTQEFLHETRPSQPFEMNGLSQELERIQQQHPAANEWTQDFMQHQPQQLQAAPFDEFELAFQRSHQQPQPLQQPIQGTSSSAVTNWNSTFQPRHHITNTFIPSQFIHGTERDAFEKAFEQVPQVNWEQEFASAAQETSDWASEFQQEAATTTKDNTAINDKDALAKTAAMLLDTVDVESNPKFKNSQFMHLMRRLRDSEVTVDGDKLVETTKSNDWASEFDTSTKFKSWTNEFNYEQNQHQQPGDWASKATGHQELFTKTGEMEYWVQQYNKNLEQITNAKESNDWLNQAENYRTTDPAYDTYHFSLNNPYIINPEAIDGEQHTSLSDSIMALEAKAQLETSNANAWKTLGLKQQENERDVAAIAALRQAMKMNPGLLDGWIALAVSYTNENCRADAFDALEQWLANHPDYRHLQLGHSEDRHQDLINVFLEAARSLPGVEMDPEVQIGLGILFNVSGDYDKAIDCFKAALNSKPQDYLLWNKLGATIANSGDSEGAVEAYFNALMINPAYVRARYNVAISCINMEQHNEAVEHLLTALALQQSNDGGASLMEEGNTMNMPGGMSDSIWGTLRMLMKSMNREDLANQCDKRNLDSFRGEFNF
ncbi:TPR-like protein [Backusella circina FSU 941]|nr:TPR-like protein [Backusella circina FSU 941]